MYMNVYRKHDSSQKKTISSELQEGAYFTCAFVVNDKMISAFVNWNVSCFG
jgi:hypothetical protein